MLEEDKIKKILENHEKRISKIENVIFHKRGQKVSKPPDVYSGLNGGIQLLIDNGFLNTPKSLEDVKNELKKEGYHYGSGPIGKALSVYFVKDKKILTRFKENKVWKYVIRK